MESSQESHIYHLEPLLKFPTNDMIEPLNLYYMSKALFRYNFTTSKHLLLEVLNRKPEESVLRLKALKLLTKWHINLPEEFLIFYTLLLKHYKTDSCYKYFEKYVDNLLEQILNFCKNNNKELEKYLKICIITKNIIPSHKFNRINIKNSFVMTILYFNSNLNQHFYNIVEDSKRLCMMVDSSESSSFNKKILFQIWVYEFDSYLKYFDYVGLKNFIAKLNCLDEKFSSHLFCGLKCESSGMLNIWDHNYRDAFKALNNCLTYYEKDNPSRISTNILKYMSLIYILPTVNNHKKYIENIRSDPQFPCVKNLINFLIILDNKSYSSKFEDYKIFCEQHSDKFFIHCIKEIAISSYISKLTTIVEAKNITFTDLSEILDCNVDDVEIIIRRSFNNSEPSKILIDQRNGLIYFDRTISHNKK